MLLGIEVHSTMGQRGNPNWGRGQQIPVPATPSEFEKLASHLGLTPESYASSEALRSWCQKNVNRCYIPEWLLEAWQIETEENTT
jgi:hypothetical protein